ncbi:MAG: hypothetical protein DRI61_06990, partial [Chloroflexi bacterium]
MKDFDDFEILKGMTNYEDVSLPKSLEFFSANLCNLAYDLMNFADESLTSEYPMPYDSDERQCYPYDGALMMYQSRVDDITTAIITSPQYTAADGEYIKNEWKEIILFAEKYQENFDQIKKNIIKKQRALFSRFEKQFPNSRIEIVQEFNKRLNSGNREFVLPGTEMQSIGACAQKLCLLAQEDRYQRRGLQYKFYHKIESFVKLLAGLNNSIDLTVEKLHMQADREEDADKDLSEGIQAGNAVNTNNTARPSAEDEALFSDIARDIKANLDNYREAGQWLNKSFGEAVRERLRQNKQKHGLAHCFNDAIGNTIGRPPDKPGTLQARLTQKKARRLLLIIWLLTDTADLTKTPKLTEFQLLPYKHDDCDVVVRDDDDYDDENKQR